jgi:hypothetical protein
LNVSRPPVVATVRQLRQQRRLRNKSNISKKNAAFGNGGRFFLNLIWKKYDFKSPSFSNAALWILISKN